MSKIKLIIADEQQDYAMALMLYLQAEHGGSFDVICFTQNKLLQEYINTNHDIDILLATHEMHRGLILHPHIRVSLLLVDNAGDTDNEIFKYQKADQIIRRILEGYDKSGTVPIRMRKPGSGGKLISIYSPAGSAGKTTVAFGLAQQYVMHSKKVLFVSLESFTALSLFSYKENCKGVVFLLHMIKNSLPNLTLKLKNMALRDDNSGIFYLERESNAMEYKDLTIDDIEMLIRFLKTQSEFDAIIFDLDSALNDTMLGAFKFSDHIINVYGNAAADYLKQQDFARQLGRICSSIGVEISDRLLTLRNKHESTMVHESSVFEDQAHTVHIPNLGPVDLIKGSSLNAVSHFKALYDMLECDQNARAGASVYE